MTGTPLYMPIYIGDYLKRTIHLSNEEHGAYLKLLCYCWDNEGRIKNDKKTLKNITNFTHKKMQNLLAFFKEKDGYLIDENIIKELAEAKKRIVKQKLKCENARKAKQEKSENKVSIIDSITEPLEGSQLQLQPKDKEKNKQKEILEDSFEEFWKAYPRGKDKKLAKQKYIQSLKEVSHDEIMQGVLAYNDEIRKNKTEEHFIKHAKTWLHNQCWQNYSSESGKLTYQGQKVFGILPMNEKMNKAKAKAQKWDEPAIIASTKKLHPKATDEKIISSLVHYCELAYDNNEMNSLNRALHGINVGGLI